jgi:MbtH protein
LKGFLQAHDEYTSVINIEISTSCRDSYIFISGETMGTEEEREDHTIYRVVMNHEEQYSIWPAHKENAPGWKDAGKSGTKEECLAYVKEVWTDMRPLSLRKKMEEAARKSS